MPKGIPGSNTDVPIVCKHCGITFYVRAYRTHTAFYCSRKCKIQYELSHKHIPKICVTCEKSFNVIPARRTTAKYCSRKCYYKAKYGSIEVMCPICKKTFPRSPSKHQRYCSRKCAGKASYIGIAKHSNAARRKIAALNLPEQCCKCGYSKYPQILQVHHIDGDRSNNSWDNLTLLCPNCHNIHHHVQRFLLVKTIYDLIIEAGILIE